MNQPDILGLQFQIAFDEGALELVDLKEGILRNENISISNGLVKTSWNTGISLDLIEQEPLFTLICKSNTIGSTSNFIWLSQSEMLNEGYSAGLEIHPIQLEFTNEQREFDQFQLLSNRPNPFSEKTILSFNLPDHGKVHFTFYTTTGKVLSKKSGQFQSGSNEVEVHASELNQKGVILYKMETPFGSQQGKLVVL